MSCKFLLFAILIVLISFQNVQSRYVGSAFSRLLRSIFGASKIQDSDTNDQTVRFQALVPELPESPKMRRSEILGSGFYHGYQIDTLRGRYRTKRYGGRRLDFDFDEWNEWRVNEGMLCRYDSDCLWIDPDLICIEYELAFLPNVS